MKYYIQQFGGYWSLSKDEWIELLKIGATQGCCNLTEYKMLRSKPKSHNIKNVLDWNAEEFADELELIN